MKNIQGTATLTVQGDEKCSNLIVAYVDFDCGISRITIASISKKIAESDPEILAGFIEICKKSVPAALKLKDLKANGTIKGCTK